MRRYETFIILNPDLSEEQRLPVLERIKEVLAQMSGVLIRVDEWGSRKLAYAIKKKERGYYVRLDFCGTSQFVSEMERFCRIDERVLKYMTVLLDNQPDVARILEEMAKAEESAQPAAEITPAGAASPAEVAPAAVAPAVIETAPAEAAPTAAPETTEPSEPVTPEQEA
jgi:small subunit ribosomal protein S6